jgi:hypothetical protein
MTNKPTPEERLATLIAALPPAPEAWVRRAQEIAEAPHTPDAGPGAADSRDISLTRAEIDAAIAMLENALTMLEVPEVEVHGQGLPSRVSRARSELESALELMRRRRGDQPPTA